MGLERCIPLSFAASSAGKFSGSTPIIDSELGLKPVSGHYPAFHLPEAQLRQTQSAKGTLIN